MCGVGFVFSSTVDYYGSIGFRVRGFGIFDR